MVSVIALWLAGFSAVAGAFVLFRQATIWRDEATDLEAARARATLSVEAEPAGAQVWLDGKPLGDAPTVYSEYLKSKRRVSLELSHPGHETLTLSSVLVPGQKRAVRAALTKVAPQDASKK